MSQQENTGVADLDLRPALEAVLMVVDEPATEEHLAKVLERPRRAVADALRELADEYTVQRRGFELRLVAGGWRFYTRPEYAAAVEELRPGRPAGPADPGGAGDPRGGRVPPAGQPFQGLRGPWGEL